MQAVKFPEANVILGKNQDEYLNLPAYIQPGPEGFMHFKYKLSEEDLASLQKDPHIYFRQMTFNRGFSPVSVSVECMIPGTYKPKDWPANYSTVIDHVQMYFAGDRRALDEFLADCQVIPELSHDVMGRDQVERILFKEITRQQIASMKAEKGNGGNMITPASFHNFLQWAKNNVHPDDYRELFEQDFEDLRKKISLISSQNAKAN